MTAELFLQKLKEDNILFIDFRFTDIQGLWHHLTFPLEAVDEKMLTQGIYFDGSSIKGWRLIHESDMVLMPDLTHWFQDPFTSQSTAVVFGDVYDPISMEPYERDPRSMAKKTEKYLKTVGFADTAYFGPEAEFFIFDGVSFDVNSYSSFYELTSDEFPNTSGKREREYLHGHRPHPKGGYFPVAPVDALHDMRSEMISQMASMGLVMEKHHHEVAPAQHELGFQYSTLVQSADHLQIYKYAVRNVAHNYGKTATFMPKPVYGDNGSGMHVHQSLWLDNQPLFYGEGYAQLSQLALWYIGGILKHAKALNAFTNPSTNSYKRLVPGYEAPVICAYSARNRSASCRIPTSCGDKAKRVEVRFPDPMANSYLAFSAMLLAGIDGIRNKISPGIPADVNLYEDHKAAQHYPTVSRSLYEALESLQADHQFLLAGNVFTEDFIQAYIEMKIKECHQLDSIPHPVEFQLYYSI